MALDTVLKLWPLPTRARKPRRKTGRSRRTKSGGLIERAKQLGLGLAGTITLLGLSLLLVLGYQALLSNDLFAVKVVTVSGLERLDRNRVRKLAGIDGSLNLLRMDPDLVAAKLTGSPWVETAEVRRVLPDELRIHLVEYRPMALLMADGLWYVDSRGNRFKRVEPGEGVDLPVLSGLKGGDLEQDGGRADLKLGLEIIDRLSRGEAPLSADQVSEVNLDQGLGATLLPLGRSPRVILGRGSLGLKFEHWRRVLADLKARRLLGRVEYLDLRLKDRAFVGLKAG